MSTQACRGEYLTLICLLFLCVLSPPAQIASDWDAVPAFDFIWEVLCQFSTAANKSTKNDTVALNEHINTFHVII